MTVLLDYIKENYLNIYLCASVTNLIILPISLRRHSFVFLPLESCSAIAQLVLENVAYDFLLAVYEGTPAFLVMPL